MLGSDLHSNYCLHCRFTFFMFLVSDFFFFKRTREITIGSIQENPCLEEVKDKLIERVTNYVPFFMIETCMKVVISMGFEWGHIEECLFDLIFRELPV